ncbi:YheC/YheD family protein [Paenibacillus xerothermodurans]|nr:YheC/YheD family protein [Paenibacillus xerothermodurans]
MSRWDPSKWELHQLYLKHPRLRKLLPPTSLLTRRSLAGYIKDYGTVYIKGNTSHTGSNIIKAWKTEKGYRFVKERGKPVDVYSINDLYDKVKDGRAASSVLVQKAIELGEIDGRPFTIRLMLMRDGSQRWRYAGMIAKVSGKGSVISNVRRGGGYATTVDDALAKSYGYARAQIWSVRRELIRSGFQIISHATRSGYPSYETGIDLGMDRTGKLWIIEVNLDDPSYKLFDRLSDKKYYHRINALAKAYKERRLMSKA